MNALVAVARTLCYDLHLADRSHFGWGVLLLEVVRRSEASYDFALYCPFLIYNECLEY